MSDLVLTWKEYPKEKPDDGQIVILYPAIVKAEYLESGDDGYFFSVNGDVAYTSVRWWIDIQALPGPLMLKTFIIKEVDGDFYTPPPFRVCLDCNEDLFNEPRYDIPCPNNGTGHIPIYYTIQQWEELTGRTVPDDMPVWYFHEDLFEWRIACFGFFDVYPHVQGGRVVIATEAGRPPKDWRPE